MKKTVIISLPILVVISLLGAYVFFDINRQSDSDTIITDFSECAKLQSSIVTADYPNSKCVTKNGEIFNETPTDFTSNDSTKSGSQSAK